LLRVVQERKIRRVGGTKEIDIDVRLVAASSTSLEESVRQGQFRADLFHRLNVARLDLPPLRERAEDIPILASHFVERYAQEMGRGRVSVSPEVMEILVGYSWPGNVRELQNILKRTLAWAKGGTLTVEDLPDEVVAQAGERRPLAGTGFFALREQRMAAFEKEYLRALLERCQGEVSAAAREAELPRGTLYRLFKKHDLNPAAFRAAALTAAPLS
jgi:two-component system response regulator AtoC